jgi:transketolase
MNFEHPHDSIRGHFFFNLYEMMEKDPDIMVITADLGYPGFDRIQEDFPNRFFNVGAAEQLMLDMAVGMAYAGKKPYCYSITTFLIYRPFETLRTYIAHEKLNVTLCGSGIGFDYAHDGISHYSQDVTEYLDVLGTIQTATPNKASMRQVMDSLNLKKGPKFLWLGR